jgi:hypothetical protein
MNLALSLHYQRDFSVDYAKLLSYQETAILVNKRMGNDKLSDQRIFNILDEYAQTIKLQQEIQTESCESVDYQCIVEPVDIYDKESQEVIFLSDGVCVGEQKLSRDFIKKQGKNENKEIFGQKLVPILDWYHLRTKVHQLMSQIATSKALKKEFGPPMRFSKSCHNNSLSQKCSLD